MQLTGGTGRAENKSIKNSKVKKKQTKPTNLKFSQSSFSYQFHHLTLQPSAGMNLKRWSGEKDWLAGRRCDYF